MKKNVTTTKLVKIEIDCTEREAKILSEELNRAFVKIKEDYLVEREERMFTVRDLRDAFCEAIGVKYCNDEEEQR